MAQSKTYLTVPFAQKDEAKSLGARWDASQKKWYVPPDKDIGLFAKWPVFAADKLAAATTTTTNPAIRQLSETNSPMKPGFITFPSINDFTAYSGDEPPWA